MNNQLWCYLLCSCLLLLPACEPRQQLFQQPILQFGTVIDITLIHDDINQVEQAFTDIEKQLQQHRNYWHAWEASDLHQFNQSLTSSKFIAIPESLAELISLSQTYYLSSQRLFNPALGKLIAAYGFHADSVADEALIANIQKNLPDMQDLVVNKQMATITNPNLQLDFGGIAKGYSIAKIADWLKMQGFQNFLINAGGDVLVSGQRFDKPWTIAIQNPFAPGAIASIQLSGDHQLLTSGNYRRFYQKQDEIVHHIIDPRSGRPSSYISSATVLTKNAVLADVAATTLMIDGWQNHASLTESLGVSDYLIINQAMQIIVSRPLSDKLEWMIDSKQIVVD